jgi:sigma-E processing peptidase SpoIIGA
MYIELFLADNTLMNLLILRLACALCARPARLMRTLLTSFAGAVYAALSVSSLPVLSFLPFRIMLGFLMAFGMPFSDFREYAKNAASLFASAFITGGAIFALSFLIDNGTGAGAFPLPLRTALLGAAAAFFFVPAARNWVRKRRLDSNVFKLRLTHGKIQKVYTAILDTGNMLSDPLTGLGAVILFDPELKPYAVRPIPCGTVGGSMTLPAFVPEKLEIFMKSWRGIPAVCAVSSERFKDADALIGKSVLPL